MQFPSSLHIQLLTWPYSLRFHWHVLAECWVQTFAQTWRSQTRGWKSRLESYCFISCGWCGRQWCLRVMLVFKCLQEQVIILAGAKKHQCHICLAKTFFQDEFSITGDCFAHSNDMYCDGLGWSLQRLIT